MTGSTISTLITTEVTLGTGVFLSPLTITAAGRINGPAEVNNFQVASAIYVGPGISGASILDRGQINGILPQFDSLSIPAIVAESPLTLNNYSTIVGQSGIYLDAGGTVTNAGFIAGSDARSQHDYGIRLFSASLINSGTVYGAQYGVTGFNLSAINNTGTILGDLAGADIISTTLGYNGTLINSGSIYGKITGISASQALITNSGTVTGETYGIHISWGGTISNAGHITGGLDGVLLLNQQYQTDEDDSLINTGSIAGGYFGLAANFANVTNTGSGAITGQTFGVGVGQAGYIDNAASIYGVFAGLVGENGGQAANTGKIRGGTIGAFLFAGGVLTNASGGYVHGGITGVRDQGGYLLNAGTVSGAGYGLYLQGGGIAVNAGSIASQGEGIYLSGISATSSPDFLVNSGTVYGAHAGIILKSGTIYNLGKITGGPIGVSLVTGATLLNAGNIYGQKYGVQLTNTSMANTGSISGKTAGIDMTHGYLFNSGTISGGTYAIYGQGFTLGVGAGAAFPAEVMDKTDTSTLDLGGTGFGTLAGIGANLIGFDDINFAPGAQWFLSGNSAGLAHHQLISGFVTGDTLLLTGFTMTSIQALSDNGMILSNGTTNVSLDLAVHINTSLFHISASSLGTLITLPVPCFAAGTRILTSRGKIPVQDLRIGETVITQSGEDKPIIWIGRRSVDLQCHPRPESAQPICIEANALAENVPLRDLWVSPDHAIHIDGYLIPAKELLNNSNIYQGSRDSVTYYHVELARHAVIFAEDAAVETYLETGNKSGFENAGDAIILPSDLGGRMRHRQSCAPLLESGDLLDSIRAEILRRHHQGPARIPA